ncbi:hypothetical protein F4821DRAFT_245395 [Hypoxylon rubiginosum]|uniref:Uncharacterized protein n=1 Tax=Hypoxylon rubiginosum TaxID=110542 RepID=A0ACC0CS14_9PEZI|nr:hypothetical protein F4821DRAFT_245395 [Hypoxylon rubiginosum]
MIPKFSVLSILLVSACLVSTSLGQAEENRVSWLRDVQYSGAISDLRVERSQDTTRAIAAHDNIPSEKREPKKRPSSGSNNSTSTDDDSGARATDMSLPLSIGISLAIMAVYV